MPIDDFKLIIPARLKSSRLPNKLLKKIGTKTVLERVVDKCLEKIERKKLVVATPDKKIIELCKKINIDTFLSSDNCLTGTDRVAEYSIKNKYKYYINVQGDEIFLNLKTIEKVILEIKKGNYEIINCYNKINKKEDFYSSSVPKVVFNKNEELLYMSRAPIPSNKLQKFKYGNRQVCVYGFSRNALLLFKKYKKKTPLEKNEDIEILRFLEINKKIKMISTTGSEISIDTLKDYKLAKKIILKKI